MYSQVKPFLLQAISSLHVGSGSKIGLVDLPIQREKHTGYPKIESSSLKGAIRATVRRRVNQLDEKEQVAEQKLLDQVFGSQLDEQGTKETIAAAIAFADARLLLFPVRSMRGVYAYVTCPHVIQRWNQEVSAFLGEKGMSLLFPVPKICTASSEKTLLLSEGKQSVVLEEYTWQVEIDQATTALARKLEEWVVPPLEEGQIADRLIVLSDEDFVDFVTLSTEVHARIRIDEEKGTVEDGALWYEESIPPETIFYSFLFSGQTRVDRGDLEDAQAVECFVVQKLPAVYQIGGNSTLGQGMMRHVWLEGATSK